MSEHSAQGATQKNRKVARKRVVLRGKIVYGDDGAYSIDCFIRDITAKGARITVERGQAIPTHVYLIDVSNGVAYAAEVAWIKAPTFGLNFVRSYQIAEMNDPSLKYLKRLWTSCAR